jgi:hypothetical protein
MKDGMEEVRQARKLKLELEEFRKKGGNVNMQQSNGGSRHDRDEI